MTANSPTLSAQGPAEKRWLSRGVFGIGLSSFLSDCGHEAATAMLPALLAGFGAPAFALGIIEGVSDGLASFAKLAGGWIADRPQWRKPFAAGGSLIVALSTFAYALARSWPMVLLFRSIGWMGRGGKGPSRDALLADAVGEAQMGRAFGFERAMDTAGAVAGPLLATMLVATISVRRAMSWTFVPGVLAALAFVWLVPAGTRLLPHTEQGFLARLRKLPTSSRHFLAGVFVFGLGDFAPTLLILRAGQILTPRYGTVRAASMAVALYTLHNLIQGLASYPAGAWGDRLGKRGLLAAGYAIAAVASAGFLLGPATLPLLIVLFGLSGVAMGMKDALEKSLAAELVPAEIRGSGFGALATVNGIGDFISSVAVGLLWSSVAPAAGFLYAVVFTFAGAVVVYRWR